MKPRKNAILIGSLALVAACTAQAAQIDVVGVVTGNPTPLAPENTTVGSGVRGVRALTTNQTWTKNNEYFLTDRVFVPNGITLTIEPGTKIYGSINDNGTPTNKADDKVGSLVAARGGRIVADGTAAEPITFTAVAVWEMLQTPPVDSIFDPDTNIGVGTPTVGVMPGTTNAGLWGGVVVLGNAYVCHANASTGDNLGNALIEGFVPGGTPDDEVPTDGLPDAAEYGFDAAFPRDDNDDSGVYRYITISHGGYEFDTGREINGLTLGGVGDGTIVDHIEVFANQDDGIEFFGGTVSTSHIFLAYNQDDNFDFDSGYTGTMQFFFSIQNPGFADGGFEHDGIENTNSGSSNSYDLSFSSSNTATGAYVTKSTITLSKPRMFNGTLIGPGSNNSYTTIAAGSGQVLTEKGNHGFIYDDYYNGETYNSVIDDFSQDLAFFRDGNKSYGSTAAAAHNTVGRFGSQVPSQIDTATVVFAIIDVDPGPAVLNQRAAANNGSIDVTITSPVLTSGTNTTTNPVTINVPVSQYQTDGVVAQNIASALSANAAIAEDYFIGFSLNQVALTSKIAGASGQQGTLNTALTQVGTLGLTNVVNSSNTQVGTNTPSVTTGGGLNNISYYSGVNVRNLWMDGSGVMQAGNSAPNTNPQLTTYTRNGSNFLTAIDPRPAAGSPLLKSNGATLQSGAPIPVTYRGAFGPGADANWAGGWTRTWALGILQGGYSASVADADNDGISDAVENANSALGFNAGVSDANTVLGSLYTTTQYNANYTTGQNSVTSNPNAFSLYNTADILDLRTTAGVTVQKVGNDVTLTVPVEKSTGLNTWAPAGNLSLGPFTGDPTKEFYRLEVQGAN